MENNKDKSNNHIDILEEAERIYESLAEIPISQGIPLPFTQAGKLSLKARVFEEAIFLRFKELAGVAIKLFHENKVVSAAVITRSLLETVALYNSLYCYLEEAVTTRRPKRIAWNLLRVSLGRYSNSSGIRSVSVKKHIKRLQKKFEYVNSAYQDLSEIAHSNWMGCEDAFSKFSEKKDRIEFTSNYEHIPKNVALPAFCATITIFEHCYNKMADDNLLSKFDELCKKNI